MPKPRRLFKGDFYTLIRSPFKGASKIRGTKGLKDEVIDVLNRQIDEDSEDIYDSINGGVYSRFLDMKDRVSRRYKRQDTPADEFPKNRFTPRLRRLTSGNPVDAFVRPSRAKYSGFKISKSLPIVSYRSQLKPVNLPVGSFGKPKHTRFPDLQAQKKRKAGTGSRNVAEFIETGTSLMRKTGQNYRTLDGKGYTNTSGFHTHDRIVKDELDRLRRELADELIDNLKDIR